MTTLMTEEEKTNMSPSPPLYTTPPGSLLHLMKRDTKLSNAIVNPYGNGPSEYDFMLQLHKHHAALAVASTCALTKYDLFEFFVLRLAHAYFACDVVRSARAVLSCVIPAGLEVAHARGDMPPRGCAETCPPPARMCYLCNQGARQRCPPILDFRESWNRCPPTGI